MSASERPSDTGGPRPENQRKRAELRGPRHALIGMLAVVAIGAIAFGVLRRSDDRFLGLPPGYLEGASGLLLVGLLASVQALAAVVLLVQPARGRLIGAIAAAVAIGSSVVLVTSTRGPAWVPALLFFIGFVEILLVAGSTPRKPAHRKHVPGRR